MRFFSIVSHLKSDFFISNKNCDKSESDEKKDGQQGLSTVVLVIISVLSILVVILLCIVIGIFLKKNKAASLEETVEENHYYDGSPDNIENVRSKVVDKNDYYDVCEKEEVKEETDGNDANV